MLKVGKDLDIPNFLPTFAHRNEGDSSQVRLKEKGKSYEKSKKS